MMRRLAILFATMTATLVAGLNLAPAADDGKPPALENKSSDYEEKARALVDVEGNKRVDVATVRSYFHASPDGRLDEAGFRKLVLVLLTASGLALAFTRS